MCTLWKGQQVLVAIFLGLALIATVRAANYTVAFENQEIFSACADYPDNFIDQIVDLSGMSFDFNDEDVHVSGTLKLIKKFEDFPITMDAQILRKSRGEWISTVYNMKREDFCRSFYDKAEYWYSYTELVPEDKRTCPPPENLEVKIDTDVKLAISVPENNSEGQYKGRVIAVYGPNEEDFVCFEVCGEAYKE